MEIEFSSANLLGISIVIQWHLLIIITFMNTSHNKKCNYKNIITMEILSGLDPEQRRYSVPG